MKRVENPKTWEKTRAPQVYRHVRTGIYYVRGYVNGKDVWRSLGTDVFSVAQPKARDELAEIYRPRKAESALTSGIATFGDAAHVYEERLKANPKIKASTLEYRQKTIEALYRWWPGLKGTKLKLVTDRACLDWAKKFRAHYHATRYNNTVDTLRHILEIGVERGVIYENPAASINKAKVTGRKLQLPTKEEFAQLLNAIEKSGAGCARDCADLVRFLAYSGCRIDEASHVTWKDVDGKKGVIWINGNPETGTKNGEIRAVPMIKPMRDLLEKLGADPREPRNPKRQGKGYVLTVTECREALKTACEKVGVAKLTHHDLRHLFATQCIESGIDIPTVSRWLGHRDGGALAMRTYGHLRDEHSQRMAEKVEF